MIVELVVASGSREGQVVPVSTEKFIIGRAEDCHLKPRSELVSRYHCAILVGSDVVVRDLGSKNGVRLNGEKISGEQKLKNSDQLTIGSLEFYVHIVDDSPLLEETLSAGGHQQVSWECQPNDEMDGVETKVFQSSLLLKHLRTLNEERKQEADQPEKLLPAPMKKILS